MSPEIDLDDLPLSPSVREVGENYLEHKTVAPVHVVNALLAQHPEYGRGLAGSTRLSEEIIEGEAPIDDLLRDVLELFQPGQVHELHTRIAVIGFALNHPEIGSRLASTGLLRAFATELQEPLMALLRPDGVARWLELAGPGSAQTGEATTSSDHFWGRLERLRQVVTSGSESEVSTFLTANATDSDFPQLLGALSAAQREHVLDVIERHPALEALLGSKREAKDASDEVQQVDRPAHATQVPQEASPEQIRTALRALADTPALAQDSLRFGDYADALVEFIENPDTGKPLTIGIDAAWGMGKTSLMYMVRERLDPGSVPIPGAGGAHGKQSGFSRFRTVWFNAWKYDREEALWAALALEILAQTRKRSSTAQRFRTWVALNRERFDAGMFVQDVLTTTAKPLFLFLLGALLFVGGAAALGELPKRWNELVAAGGLAAAVSAVYAIGTTAFKYVTAPFNLNISRYVRTPNYAEKIGFLSEFENDFRRVVRVVTQDGKWPLVVFVDDLDRCGPRQAVEVIEAINSVLDTEHCVFILGMDTQAVAASIEAKYRDMKELLDQDPGGLTLGERFLEKIIQINFRIPRAEKNVFEVYIGEILTGGRRQPEAPVAKGVREAEHLIKAEQRVGKTVKEAVRAVNAQKVEAAHVQEAEKRIDERSAAEAEQVRLAVVEAAPYLEFNPRKIKRFINTFRLQALVAQKRGMLSEPTEATLLARALIIATRWPDLVEALIPDRGYVALLLEAAKVQDSVAAIEDPANLQPGQGAMIARLERYARNERLARLLKAGELIALLDELSLDDRARLADYLVLARSAVTPAAAQSPA